jgi:hypothetical protein
MKNQVRAGQVYRCKRRGHDVKVEKVSRGVVEYHDSLGRRVIIPAKRLLDWSRFWLVQEIGILAPGPMDDSYKISNGEFVSPA